ncbi:MAG: ubiquitin-activating E1 FCCH domain-containing protein [Candidatus Hodarchaeota archaeon]
MTLSVASTSLTIPSWAEFSKVGYTAGALPTVEECVDEVESKLNRGTLTESTKPKISDIKRWLHRAIQEAVEVRNYSFRRRYVIGTLTAGTYRYALPPDYGGNLVIRDTTNDVKIPVVSQHQFDILYPDMAAIDNGSILVACVKNMELWVAPAPDGSDILEISYDRTGTSLGDVLANVSGITKANPGVVTTASAHNRYVGDRVYFTGLNEMTELNGTFQTVTARGSSTTFSINDTSGYSAAETTGGACVYPMHDLTWLPEIERFRACEYALSEAFESLHQWDVSDRFRAKWERSLAKAEKADGKKKWSEQGFRARSIFQA